MIARPLQLSDIDKVKEIHSLYFKDEFEFPDFIKFMDSFLITDEDDKIIIAGGIRPIAECIIVTDKSHNMTTIGRALVETMQISSFIARKKEFEQLHAFIQDKNYMNHLIQHGFRPTKGSSLVLDV